MIKFYDLKRLDKKIHPKILKKIKKIFSRGDYILGDEVSIFEKNFSKFIGCKYAVGCANGTDAITLALKSLNLPSNSEVIIPAMTYCSTAFAVLNAGLKPVLVDLEKDKPTIDYIEIKKKITNKTKVIMPVHLYGSSANLLEIKKIIKKYNRKIYLIDDCAQAHGLIDDSSKKNKKIGSTADISCFSLYPGKNLGGYGDAGVITTNSNNFYKIIKNLRNLGSDKKFIHSRVGQNSRLDTIQASILNVKLNYLIKNNNKRKNLAKLYKKYILNKKITKLQYSKNCVFHQYVILSKQRKKLIKLFDKHKIQYGFHYPYSINQLKVFKMKYKTKKFKYAEKIAKEGVSIPVDPNLKSKDIKKIIKVINLL